MHTHEQTILNTIINRELVALNRGKAMELEYNEFWQTKTRGTNDTEYQLYLDLADNGHGGDITNNDKPLKSYDEWLNS